MEKKNIQEYIKKLILLNIGFAVCALGVVFLLNSGTGVSPWDVLATGISNTFGMTVGQAVIVVSVLLVVIEVIAGTSVGIGTLLNMVMIGIYIDWLLNFGIIVQPGPYGLKLLYILVGTIILNFGIWLYMSQGLGSGPRDGLMVVMAKRMGKSVGFTKVMNEVVAVIIGYLLGGNFGVGTVLIALFSGPILKKQFDMLSFDAKQVEHEYITDYFKKAA